MPNRMSQFGRGLQKNTSATKNNTRRQASNLPQIERKLDILGEDIPYGLTFKLTNNSHSVMLDLRIKPDNCCDCDPGGQAQTRDAVMIVDAFGPDIAGNSDGINYPAIYNETIVNTGTITHWVTLPVFWGPIAQPYEGYGGFTRAPDGKGVIVPVDGIYSFSFQNMAHGAPTSTSVIRASIRKLTTPTEQNPEPDWEDISVRIYSTAKGNISTLKEWPLSTLNIGVYAYCIPLLAGDIIGGWLQATDVINWEPGLGDLDGNKSAISFLGLGYATIMGYIRDANNNPVSGITIRRNGEFVHSAGAPDSDPPTPAITYPTTVTDINGFYIFENLTPIPYTLWINPTDDPNYDNLFSSITGYVTARLNVITKQDFWLTAI